LSIDADAVSTRQNVPSKRRAGQQRRKSRNTLAGPRAENKLLSFALGLMGARGSEVGHP
jgi:hypothetical protein